MKIITAILFLLNFSLFANPIVGYKAPNFSLLDQDGKIRSLSDFKGKKLVVYFFPKADTPG